MPDEFEAAEASQDSGVQFEIDLESEAPPTDSSSAAAQSRASDPPLAASTPSAAAPGGWEDRYQALERDFQYLQSQITPYLQLQQQQLVRANRPPRTLEEIQNDPNATAKDLVQYVEWLNDQRLAQIRSETEHAALRASSTQRIRGLLTAESLGGPGRDYDSLVAKHVAPAVRQNPWIAQAVHAASPQDPALGEYILGAIAEIAQRSGGDIAKAMRSIWNALDAEQRGAREVTSRITEAQRQQAQRVVPGSFPGTTRTRRLSAQDISTMSDADFDRLDRQISGGF
jgi:hypothetical protein